MLSKVIKLLVILILVVILLMLLNELYIKIILADKAKDYLDFIQNKMNAL